MAVWLQLLCKGQEAETWLWFLIPLSRPESEARCCGLGGGEQPRAQGGAAFGNRCQSSRVTGFPSHSSPGSRSRSQLFSRVAKDRFHFQSQVPCCWDALVLPRSLPAITECGAGVSDTVVTERHRLSCRSHSTWSSGQALSQETSPEWLSHAIMAVCVFSPSSLLVSRVVLPREWSVITASPECRPDTHIVTCPALLLLIQGTALSCPHPRLLFPWTGL